MAPASGAAGDEGMNTVASKNAAETLSPNSAQSLASTRIIEHLAEGAAKTTVRKLVIPRLPFTRQEADRILAAAPGSTDLKALDKSSRNCDFVSHIKFQTQASKGSQDQPSPEHNPTIPSPVIRKSSRHKY
jgi:hypothetical protein